MAIQWQTVTLQISSLIPWDKNPRIIRKKEFDKLKRSIDKFGLAEPIVINANNVIIGGHARYRVLMERGEQTVQCYKPSRSLSDSEQEELCIRLNRDIAGEWDFDILANEYDAQELVDWGFDEAELSFAVDEPDEGQPLPDNKNCSRCPQCGYEGDKKEFKP